LNQSRKTTKQDIKTQSHKKISCPSTHKIYRNFNHPNNSFEINILDLTNPKDEKHLDAK